jgi:D-lactate dehydrogenase (cytochrome)
LLTETLLLHISVPISRLPDLILSVKNELVTRNITAPLGGHIGDGFFFRQVPQNGLHYSFLGNFHAFILYKDEEELKHANEVVDYMILKALELDGTCTALPGFQLKSPRIDFRLVFKGTGEHGVD